MHSGTHQQLTCLFDLVSLGFLAGMGTVAAPLHAIEFDAYSRTFPFSHRAPPRARISDSISEKYIDARVGNVWIAAKVLRCFAFTP
jgi:hypothetical protein